MGGISIRPETPGDEEAIADLLRGAYAGEEEAGLVEKLRAGGFVKAELVAVDGGRIVGHVLFSEITIERPEGAVRAVCLAPLAVLPPHRRRGIGTALVRAGLDACREAGERIAIVVGHPGYYARFGFSHDLTEGLDSQWSGEAFRALELATGALDGVSGAVRFAPPFGDL